MKIDDLEFRDLNGNEINPTKEQMAILISHLNKENQQLKSEQNKVAVEKLEELSEYIYKIRESAVMEGYAFAAANILFKISEILGELKGESDDK